MTFTQTINQGTTNATPDRLFLDYVDPSTASPRYASGHIGGSIVFVVVTDDFEPVPGDIVDVTVDDDGVPTTSQKVGHATPVDGGVTERMPPLPADLGPQSYGPLGFGHAPPMIVTSSPDGGQVGNTAEYGHAGVLGVSSYVWFGHQLFNYFTPFFLRLMVLNLTVATLDPAPVTLDLLAESEPGVTATVRETATISGLAYTGPSPGWRWIMPAQWVLDIGNGDAGGIRLRAGDATPGLTQIHIGRFGSLSIGPLLPGEELNTGGTLKYA